jgi:FtsZ-binding cell division protein ZapB
VLLALSAKHEVEVLEELSNHIDVLEDVIAKLQSEITHLRQENASFVKLASASLPQSS